MDLLFRQSESSAAAAGGCRVDPASDAARPPSEPMGVELFTEGDELYAAMLASIRGARHAVRMESYIFASDEIGWQFAEALAERARRASMCGCTLTQPVRGAVRRLRCNATCAIRYAVFIQRHSPLPESAST
jgi:phosphatidylserine/phosphatidylglycerophosphate/cardiolipin synthase-like enzyme